MTDLTIIIIKVEDGCDNEGVLGYSVTFRIKEWEFLGAFNIQIPRTTTKAQAKALIDAYVMELATNTHELYGIEWIVTV